MQNNYEWVGTKNITPGDTWLIWNETAGYEQVTIGFRSNVTVEMALVGFSVWGKVWGVTTFAEEFELPVGEVYKTYDVRGSKLVVWTVHRSGTTVASVYVGIYMTT